MNWIKQANFIIKDAQRLDSSGEGGRACEEDAQCVVHHPCLWERIEVPVYSLSVVANAILLVSKGAGIGLACCYCLSAQGALSFVPQLYEGRRDLV